MTEPTDTELAEYETPPLTITTSWHELQSVMSLIIEGMLAYRDQARGIWHREAIDLLAFAGTVDQQAPNARYEWRDEVEDLRKQITEQTQRAKEIAKLNQLLEGHT